MVQDDVNLRYSGACPGVPADMQCAVPALPSEGKGVPEDPEDSGQKAINYRSDPALVPPRRGSGHTVRGPAAA